MTLKVTRTLGDAGAGPSLRTTWQQVGWVSSLCLGKRTCCGFKALGTGRLRSLDRAVFPKVASVLPDHTHFFPTQTCILDRHAEEHVFVLLVVGSKGVLVEQNQFRVVRAAFRELGKLFPDGSDQAGLSLHALVIGHRAMRIADP